MTFPTPELQNFVYREARLIDQHRFEEWLALYADDGYYWMPLEWGQTDPRLVGSLMYEDKMLLGIRVERLKGNRTFSQKPKSRCHHVLQAPQIESRDEAANRYVVWTRCTMSRRGSTSRPSTPPGRRTRWRSRTAR